MAKIIFKTTILLLTFFSFKANAGDYNYPNNNYRSPSNTYYWKNRPPFPGYWQQDIYYKIDAELDDKANTVTGKEKLTYWNNSPDTLKVVYFHMYQNAFQPGSYYDMLNIHNHIKPVFGYYEKQKEDIVVTKIESGGQPLQTWLDNTVMQVKLLKPLLPGASVDFDINFTSYFDMGSLRRRMKLFIHNGYKHFDCVHWYPRICVYDRKSGWDVDQHLDKEFYGDFGAFDVSLTLPNNYIMDATGTLLNKDEVLPADLRQKLDISNFANKPNEEKPSEIIAPDGTKKIWRFHAENVHDFAWTADPTYRIGEKDWNGIQCIALVQEEHAGHWQDAPDFIANVIKTYSTDIGMYGYPKMVVCDARDGMEYPMLTLCGGIYPEYHYVIAHEVGHNWFFGMLGNNETYRAIMDEGFTQFLTAWSLDKIDGKYGLHYPPRNKYIRKFKKRVTNDDQSVYRGYITAAMQEDNTTLNTHSSDFNGTVSHNGGYSQVYFKMASMLYNLQYVLGDSLFLAAMHHYFEQWKFCHPYPEDFRNSVINYTHVNLTWFFDEWLETAKTIDYGIKNVKKGDSSGKYTVTFERFGKMQMPLDFTVINTAGQKFNYTIPNTYFAKSTNATVLPYWTGYDNVMPDYSANIKIQGKIKNIIIDTSNRLADVDMLDNRMKGKVKWRFDSQIENAPDLRYYDAYWRPDIWYNSVDGFKAGLHFDGNYMNYEKIFSLTAWYNTGLLANNSFLESQYRADKVSFDFSYRSPLKWLDKDISWSLNLRSLDGLELGEIGLTKKMRNNIQLSATYKAMGRLGTSNPNYLLYPGLWELGQMNNTINLTMNKNYSLPHSYGNFDIKLKTTGPGSAYDYTIGSIGLKHNAYWKKFVLHARAYTEYTTGTNIAPESQLYLAGGNEESMMENKFVRSTGFFPQQWLGYGAGMNNFQYGGGLDLRGYAGYLAPYTGKDGNQYLTYRGTAGAAINLELDFDKYIKLHPRILRDYFSFNTYLFYDGGVINYNSLDSALKLSDFKMDAGVGITLTIKKWGPLQKVYPLVIRFDMPLYVSDAPATEPENFKFRWVVGIGRSF